MLKYLPIDIEDLQAQAISDYRRGLLDSTTLRRIIWRTDRISGLHTGIDVCGQVQG